MVSHRDADREEACWVSSVTRRPRSVSRSHGDGCSVLECAWQSHYASSLGCPSFYALLPPFASPRVFARRCKKNAFWTPHPAAPKHSRRHAVGIGMVRPYM